MDRTQFFYTKEFEVFDLKHKNRFENVARAMFGEGVISFEMVQRGSTFWLVRIKFESSEDCGRFLRFLKQTKEREDKEMGKKERERKKCIENQIRIHEYGKQEIKTTVADVEDAYNNATCDETRDTLKRVFKDAFRGLSKGKWEDVTEHVVVGTVITGRTGVNNSEVLNICGYLHSPNGILIFTFDGKKFYEWEEEEFKLVHHKDGGLSVLRRV